jgi:hypothetical protein
LLKKLIVLKHAHWTFEDQLRRGLQLDIISYLIFGSIDPFEKDHKQQQTFLQDLTLFITKSSLPLQLVESVWIQHLTL